MDVRKDAPLAVRMRPRTLAELEGHEEVIGEGTPLWRALRRGYVPSLIFYGPPGSGKTTLARLIATETQTHFTELSAVMAGVKDIRAVVEEAQERKARANQQTILFIDEVHRFNSTQQDALLPYVENGIVTLVGATTENPMVSVRGALLSRCMVFELKKLSKDSMARIIHRALTDEERGLGMYKIRLTEEALEYLLTFSDGDSRTALNILEFLTAGWGEDGQELVITEEDVASASQRMLRFDRTGDYHYDLASAFIKSIRGSDPQATLYWLAKMIYSGEDPRFIARRMVIAASEDIGLADPVGLMLATAAFDAVSNVGMPEARIILAHVALYLATAEKSNSAYLGIERALSCVAKEEVGEVPLHLRDASYKGAKELGHGVGYKYPHDYPNHWVKQQYLPDIHRDKVFYEPTEQGRERRVLERFGRKS
ncbi:MAG TPA: replication-associated recombination protein A [Firmicutes bacterium]|nr:replication-associated recombination protein A [Bacillota bacterium]